MDLLLDAPVLVKVLSTLLLIILLNRLTGSLLASVAVGTIVLGLWSGQSLPSLGIIAWRKFSSLDNLILLFVILQVIWLSTLMSKAGVMSDLAHAVQVKLPKRFAFGALPAVIGLLPMPGGAMFSAPLVDSCDQEGNVAALLKTQTNYWYRHIWEYWWPLYPGVILALDLTGLEIWQFIPVQLPITVLAAITGYLFFLRRIPMGSDSKGQFSRLETKPLLVLVLPILTVIGVYILLQLIFPAIITVSRYLPMLIGLSVSLFVLQAQRKSSFPEWRNTILSNKALKLALLIAVIRIYGAVIEAPLPTGILMAEELLLELRHLGIPLLAVMMLIPFITGMAMGLSVGCVGASFPILLNFLGQDPSPGALLSFAVLAYGFGFMGQMLSPVHVCLVVSGQYLKTSLMQALVRLIGPAAVVMAGIFLMSQVIARLSNS